MSRGMTSVPKKKDLIGRDYKVKTRGDLPRLPWSLAPGMCLGHGQSIQPTQAGLSPAAQAIETRTGSLSLRCAGNSHALFRSVPSWHGPAPTSQAWSLFLQPTPRFICIKSFSAQLFSSHCILAITLLASQPGKAGLRRAQGLPLRIFLAVPEGVFVVRIQSPGCMAT